MIYVEQHGRCGNQLFLYGFARSIQLQRENMDEEIVMNFSNLGTGLGEFWGDSLQFFNTVSYRIDNHGNFVKRFGTIKQNEYNRIMRFLDARIPGNSRNEFSKYIDKTIFSLFSKEGLYFNRSGFWNEYMKSDCENVFVSGLFESSSFLKGIRPVLIKELTPRRCFTNENNELLSLIQNNESICISFRNWDIDVKDIKIKERRSICDIKYYILAINTILSKIDNPLFVIFSDDIEMAKKLLKEVIGNSGRIVFETGKDDVATKLSIMSQCKHFILANSTFSWWAQYLNQRSNKIVVSPKKWLNINNESSLIENDWILI